MDLRLYEREWHFYEKLAHQVPMRVPKYYGTLLGADGAKVGVIMEDLCLPGAVLCPELHEADNGGALLQDARQILEQPRAVGA